MENILNTTPRFKSIGMLTINYLVIKNSPMTAIRIIHARREYTMMLGIWYKMDRGQASLFACSYQYNYSDKNTIILCMLKSSNELQCWSRIERRCGLDCLFVSVFTLESWDVWGKQALVCEIGQSSEKLSEQHFLLLYGCRL
jgi:hypothetical protein